MTSLILGHLAASSLISAKTILRHVLPPYPSAIPTRIGFVPHLFVLSAPMSTFASAAIVGEPKPKRPRQPRAPMLTSPKSSPKCSQLILQRPPLFSGLSALLLSVKSSAVASPPLELRLNITAFLAADRRRQPADISSQ